MHYGKPNKVGGQTLKRWNLITPERQVQVHGKSNIFDGEFIDAGMSTLVGKHGNFALQFIF
jgi:hypothetical protein